MYINEMKAKWNTMKHGVRIYSFVAWICINGKHIDAIDTNLNFWQFQCSITVPENIPNKDK